MPIDLPLFFAFIGFVIVASITPGPNNLMVLASGAAFGWRKSLPHVAGIAIGVIVMMVLVNFGLGAIFDLYPAVAWVTRIGGAAWLTWMAWQLAKPVLMSYSAASSISDAPSGAERPITVLQAALFQWINPKTWAIMVTISAAYVDIAPTPGLRAGLMAATFAVVAPISNGAWLLAGQMLRQLFTGSRTRPVALLGMAALILLSAIMILIS